MKNWTLVLYFLLVGLGYAVAHADSGPLDHHFSTKVIPPEHLPIDSELFISADAGLKQHESKSRHFFFIDIRPEKSFETIHIPGSLNIPLFAIKTKAFLKNKRIVIVNEGFGYSSLVDACLQLRQSGFESVTILKGGLNFWIQKGGELRGDIFARKSLRMIAPKDFFGDSGYDAVMPVEIYSGESAAGKLLIPRIVGAKLSNDISVMIDNLTRAIETAGIDDPLYVVIIAETDLMYQNFEGLMDREWPWPLFFLKGGLTGYKQFLNDQARIRATQTRERKKTRCRTCN